MKTQVYPYYIRSTVGEFSIDICLTCMPRHLSFITPVESHTILDDTSPNELLQNFLDTNQLQLAEALVNLMEEHPKIIQEMENNNGERP